MLHSRAMHTTGSAGMRVCTEGEKRPATAPSTVARSGQRSMQRPQTRRRLPYLTSI